MSDRRIKFLLWKYQQRVRINASAYEFAGKFYSRVSVHAQYALLALSVFMTAYATLSKISTSDDCSQDINAPMVVAGGLMTVLTTLITIHKPGQKSEKCLSFSSQFEILANSIERFMFDESHNQDTSLFVSIILEKMNTKESYAPNINDRFLMQSKTLHVSDDEDEQESFRKYLERHSSSSKDSEISQLPQLIIECT